MSGKTKEMASRYLGNPEMPTVNHMFIKPNIQSLSTTADEQAYHLVTDKDRDVEWKSNIQEEDF